MKWNQKTIHQWGIDTFGAPALNTLGLAIRMVKEAVELSTALHLDVENEVLNESADVAIVVLQVANCLDFEVDQVLGIHPDGTAVLPKFKEYLELFQKTDDELLNGEQCAVASSTFAVDLISSLFHGSTDNAKKEIIKIMAMLSAIEEIYEFDLNVRIQEKMDINEARKWEKSQDGSFQHV